MISPKSSCAPEHSPIRIGKHLEGRVIHNCPIFPKLRPIQDQAFEIFGNCRGSLRGPHSWISEKSTTICGQHGDGHPYPISVASSLGPACHLRFNTAYKRLRVYL
jgi:hypothetical protein